VRIRIVKFSELGRYLQLAKAEREVAKYDERYERLRIRTNKAGSALINARARLERLTRGKEKCPYSELRSDLFRRGPTDNRS
jgi:hypothetical protein